MTIISAPIKILGLAAVGLAFAVGWKLGSYVGDLATGEKTFPWPDADIFKPREQREPLWKRQFSRITVE